MKINLQNENHVGKAIHQSVGVKIAQTSRLIVIRKQIEKEQIQIQDWIEIIFPGSATDRDGPWTSDFLKSTIRYITSSKTSRDQKRKWFIAKTARFFRRFTTTKVETGGFV